MINFYKVTVFLLVLVLVLEPVFAADEACNLKDKLELSKELISENNRDSALDLLNQTIEKCHEETIEFADLLQQRGLIKGFLDPSVSSVKDFEEALEIARSNEDKNIIKIAQYLKDLGSAYSSLGNYKKGEQILQESISILEKVEPSGEYIVYAYSKMGITLNEQGRYDEASKYYVQAITVSKNVFGENDPDHAIILSNQAVNYDKQSRYELSEKSLKKALAIFEQYPLERQSNIAITSNNIASNLNNQGKHEEAQFYLESAIQLQRLVQIGDSMDLAVMLYNLAHTYRFQYKQSESQKLFVEAHDMFIRVLGPNHPTVGIAKQGVAINFREQGRIQDAIAMNRQVQKIYEEHFDSNSNRIGDLYTFLSQDAIDLNDFTKAEHFFKESIRIFTLNRGRSSSDVAVALSRFAEFLDKQGRFAESEKLHSEAVIIMEEIARNSLQHSKSIHFLAKHHFNRNSFSKALELELQAYEILTKINTRKTGSLKAEMLSYIALFHHAQGNMKLALQYAQQADDDFEQYLLRNKASQPTNEMKKFDEIKEHYINHSLWLVEEGSEDSISKAFNLSQIAAVSSVSFAINRNNQRKFIGGKNPLVKQHQDLMEKRRLLQKKLDNIYLLSPDKNTERESSKLRKERETIEVLIERIGRQIKKELPDYSESIIPNAYTIEEVQGKIRPLQLLIKFFVTDNQVLAWAITQKDSHYYKIDLSKETLQKKIEILRNANLNHQMGLKDYPLDISFDLYNKLLDPAIRKFGDIQQILLIPHENLHLLSFHSLISSAPKEFHLDNLPWLVKQFPISILPSISSLFNLNISSDRESFSSFLGVGNPNLDGQISLSKLFSERGSLNTNEIRSLPRLPESQLELEMIAEFIDTPNVLILTGNEAYDKNIFSLNMKNFDLISFATHAVNANLGYGIEESSLVMSGLESDDINDWLLTSTEIRQLDLNAKLVILSACNTASIGSEGQSAYSGLAESFFYAGANSLLVSQWPVASNTAVELTTTMLSNFEKSSSISMSKALQGSMLSLIKRDEISYQHPFFWAPFVLVGVN